MIKYEKGSLGWLREKKKEDAKKDGFNNIGDWEKWKLEKKKKEKGTIGYFLGLVKEVGYPYEIEGFNIGPFIEWAREKGILVNTTYVERNRKQAVFEKYGANNLKEYRDDLAKREGFDKWLDYQNDIAKKERFENYAEKVKLHRHDIGANLPMSDNEDCPSYLGVHIGENYAEKILIVHFGGIEKRMPYNHPYYEFMVKGEYSIQVKTRTLIYHEGWEGWYFMIGHNNIADYFLLLAFDNRENKNLLHIWLIKRDEIIREEKFYNRDSITITNIPEYLLEFQKYELKN